MADVVQFKLERMVDELDDLEKRGLFNRQEIAEIVKKRRDFEYRLKRPSPLKQDFLAYIEYEKQLESLRRLRKKSIIRGWNKTSNDHKKWKKSLCDLTSTMRILDIYRAAVTRYKGDIELWFQYLEYCRERGHGRMKQVLAQAIRFHPNIPGLWIYAAAWEFDHNLNVAAARALMQSGLRACPRSEELWVEYLRMELTYLNKLKARKVALGEDVGTLSRDFGNEEEKLKDEDENLFMPLNETDANGSNAREDSVDKNADVFRVQGSNILQAIYCGAVEALPTSLSLRKKFLEILDNTDVAYLDELREKIMGGIQKDFSREEDFSLERIEGIGSQGYDSSSIVSGRK